MKILLLGPVHLEKEFLKQKGKYPFLLGQGQQSWVDALTDLGHEVFVFRYTDSIIIPYKIRVYTESFLNNTFPIWMARLQRIRNKFYYFSIENYLKNFKIINLAKKIKPDLVIISGGASCIYPSTIKQIKEDFKINVLLFSGINPKVGSNDIEKEMVKKHLIDAVVVNDAGFGKNWQELGAKKIIVLPVSSVDPKIHKKIKLSLEKKTEYESDVCFVGTLSEERQEILKRVQNDNGNIRLKIWGDIPSGVNLKLELLPFYKGKARGEKMVKIYNASKLALNIHSPDMTSGGNMRTFEITGSGAMQLVDYVDKNWFVNGKEIIVFNDVNDLKEKIAYYLKHDRERKKIANAGYKRAHKDHTYKKHFLTLLKQFYGKS